MDLTAAFPTFIVTLREGFEAALVVGIIMAALAKAQQQKLYAWVYAGIATGIGGSLLVGIILAKTVGNLTTINSVYAPLFKQVLATSFGLVAIAMLSWMLLWMNAQAKSLKGEIESSINSALAGANAGRAVFLLVAIAVLREGFETVLFILAKFQQDWALPTVGAFIGLSLAAILGWLLFAVGVKLDLRLFFQVMTTLLLLIVGGLVLSCLFHLDRSIFLWSELSGRDWCLAAGGSCILGQQVWDGSQILSDRTFPGIILKALFGYRQTLYLLQVLTYGSFLTLLTIWLRKDSSSGKVRS